MGAYNFLSRRLDVARAEKIILSGRGLFRQTRCRRWALWILVVEDGLGEEAVREYVERNFRRHQAERAVYFARQLVQPVRLSDLQALAELWVDTALNLAETDLRRIDRLANAQNRRKLMQRPVMVAAE